MLRRVVVVVALATVMGVLVGVTPPARAAVTIFVDINDGSCDDVSGPVYCNIQPAVNDAASGDTIEIAAGTYTSTGTYVVSITSLDLTLAGAGEGVTIIDGQETRGGIEVNGGSVIIHDLSVVNGDASGSGGGIQLSAINTSSVTDVTVADNASASPMVKYRAASPPTSRNADRSEATTGVPDAIASTSTIPKDSPPRLGAT